MIVGIVLGAVGCLIALFALKCLKIGNTEEKVKASMTLTAGILFILAGSFLLLETLSSCYCKIYRLEFLGVCGIAGVSAFANLIVQSFRFTTYTDEEFGMLGGGGAGGMMGSLTPR